MNDRTDNVSNEPREVLMKQCSIWLWLLVMLTGCLNIEVRERRVQVQPDGSGLLEYTTAASSGDAGEVSGWLKGFESGDEDKKLAEMAEEQPFATRLLSRVQNVRLASY
jgi:hypothetical protein